MGTHLYAATATGRELTSTRDSLPPKPPPIRFTRQTTRLLLIPRTSAVTFWKKDTCNKVLYVD
jgi:hypothetical protein